jgi:hypothetical protein
MLLAGETFKRRGLIAKGGAHAMPDDQTSKPGLARAFRAAIQNITQRWSESKVELLQKTKLDESEDALRATYPAVTRQALTDALKTQRIAVVNAQTRRSSRVTIPTELQTLMLNALNQQNPPTTGDTILSEHGEPLSLEGGAGAVKTER